MRSAYLLAVLIGSCCPWATASADDPDFQRVLNEARSLAGQGKYEEALRKHLWFHENSKNAPGMGGVRLSFALADWIKLGEKYPKAREALVGVRDDDLRAFEAGRGTFELFHDLASIDRYLDERAKTIALFKEIRIKKPELAALCYLVAEEDLASAREYAICGEFIADATARLDQMASNREMQAKFALKGQPRMEKMADQAFVKSVRRLVEILVGAGRKPEAEDVRTRALVVLDNPSIRSAVEDAVRGPKPSNGEELAVREVVERYVQAREVADPKAIEALFTADADQLVSDGAWRKGRDELVRGMIESSRKNPDRRTITVESVRFLAPDVALADGRYKQEAAQSGGTDREMWTSIALKRGPDGWKIAAIRNMLPSAPPAR